MSTQTESEHRASSEALIAAFSTAMWLVILVGVGFILLVV